MHLMQIDLALEPQLVYLGTTRKYQNFSAATPFPLCVASTGSWPTFRNLAELCAVKLAFKLLQRHPNPTKAAVLNDPGTAVLRLENASRTIVLAIEELET